MRLKYFDFQSIMQEKSFVKKNILIIKVFLTIEDSFSICGKQQICIFYHHNKNSPLFLQ